MEMIEVVLFILKTGVAGDDLIQPVDVWRENGNKLGVFIVFTVWTVEEDMLAVFNSAAVVLMRSLGVSGLTART